MSAMTILSVRGTPVRSGQVRKAVRMSTGRCNPHRATQNQCGSHRSRLASTPECTCRGSGPSAALWQTHKPDDTPVNGHLSTSEARNVPWWTLPGCCSCSVDAAARAVWQDGIPACNRRRALQIRRYDPPTFVALSGRRQRGYSRPEWKDYPETSWTDRQQVPSGNGRYHRLTLL